MMGEEARWHWKRGMARLLTGNLDGAEEDLKRALGADGVRDWVLASIRIEFGKLADLRGDRAKAEENAPRRPDYCDAPGRQAGHERGDEADRAAVRAAGRTAEGVLPVTARKWIPIVVGIVIFVMVVGAGLVGGLIYVVTRQVKVQTMSASGGQEEFDRLLASMAGQKPFIELPAFGTGR